jgi:hypothetical protein
LKPPRWNRVAFLAFAAALRDPLQRCDLLEGVATEIAQIHQFGELQVVLSQLLQCLRELGQMAFLDRWRLHLGGQLRDVKAGSAFECAALTDSQALRRNWRSARSRSC